MGRDQHDDDHARALIQPVKRASLIQRLRNNFLTGIVVIAPIGITAYLTWTVVQYVDSQVLPQVLPLIPERFRPDQYLPFTLPGMGIVFAILFTVAIGSLTKNFFGRELLRIGERWVDRMPVVRSLYNALKQIVETIFTQSQSSFEKACLVEYPRKGIWAVAFVSTKTKGEVPKRVNGGAEMLSVFLPTTPNPTSGFLLFVPKEDVVILDMSVEEAAKLVISAGLVTPQELPIAGEEAVTEPAQPDADLEKAAMSNVPQAVTEAMGEHAEIKPAPSGLRGHPRKRRGMFWRHSRRDSTDDYPSI